MFDEVEGDISILQSTTVVSTAVIILILKTLYYIIMRVCKLLIDAIIFNIYISNSTFYNTGVP